MAEGTAQPRSRGIALIMVMVLVAAASVMAYAMLASTSVRVQVTRSTVDRLQRQYLAESGLNLALYYIQNPSASPVGLVYGDGGNVHYPGESAIILPNVPGSIAVTVDNPENGRFEVTSVATLQGRTLTRRATIVVTKSYTFPSGGNHRGSLALNSKVTINGGITTDGSVNKNNATVNGTIIASNGASLGGVNSTKATAYPNSALHYLPYYFYNGKRYRAARMPTSVIGVLFDLDVVNNPCNVWYADRDIKFLAGTIVNGTVISNETSRLTIQSSVVISPKEGMPALIAGENLHFSGNNRSLQCNGMAYVGGQITGQGVTGNCQFTVNGALVTGANGWPAASSYAGSVLVNYDPAKAQTRSFFDEIETINTLNVQQWGSEP